MLFFKSRAKLPEARNDRVPLNIYLGLGISDIVAFGVMVVILPLFTLGTDLPFLIRLLSAGSWMGSAFLLFMVKRRDENLLVWLTRMIPYWTRQRKFRHMRRSARLTAHHDRADEAVNFLPNHLSFEWAVGADGVTEVHVHESYLRPYLGWMAVAGEALPPTTARLPS